MFTGIVEAKGRISLLATTKGDLTVTVDFGKLDVADVKLGDSIATNGVCLTVVELNSSQFKADVSKETLELSCFAHYQVGQSVNLEKALTPSSRLGGHLVSGHIDGIAEVVSIEPRGRATDYWLKAPKNLLKYIAYKGSVAIDGISLTVNAVENNTFKLTIVPHTGVETTIDQLKIGCLVNLEVDQIARYLERLIMPATEDNEKHTAQAITIASLTKAGFVK